jgi:hypothetical protein
VPGTTGKSVYTIMTVMVYTDLDADPEVVGQLAE